MNGSEEREPFFKPKLSLMQLRELWFRKKKTIKKSKAQMLWAKMCSLNDKESKSLRRLRRKLAKKKLKGGK